MRTVKQNIEKQYVNTEEECGNYYYYWNIMHRSHFHIKNYVRKMQGKITNRLKNQYIQKKYVKLKFEIIIPGNIHE